MVGVGEHEGDCLRVGVQESLQEFEGKVGVVLVVYQESDRRCDVVQCGRERGQKLHEGKRQFGIGGVGQPSDDRSRIKG